MNQRVSCTSRSQYTGPNAQDANANPSGISIKNNPSGTLRTGASAISYPCEQFKKTCTNGMSSAHTNPCESLIKGGNIDPCGSYKAVASGMNANAGFKEDPCAKARETGLEKGANDGRDYDDKYNRDGGRPDGYCECFEIRDRDGDNDNTNNDPDAQVKKCGGLKGSFNNACGSIKQCASSGKYLRMLKCLIVFGIGVVLTKQMQTVANELG